jgi:hypothetical protein
MPPRLNWFFAVYFFLCSVAAMHGQSFYEVVQATEGGVGCVNNSSTKLEISCSYSWSNAEGEGFAESVSENGYGDIRAYAYSTVTILEDDGSGADSGAVTSNVYDNLSVLGLENNAVAYMKLKVECLECAKYENLSIAWYLVQASTDYGNGTNCSVPGPEYS